MKTCQICKEESPFLSKALKICLDCIRTTATKSLVWGFIEKAHSEVRKKYNLPPFPPKTKGGIECNICQNQCRISEGEKVYCGLRKNKSGKLESKISEKIGLLYSYFDPIPTNCCAAWFCPALKEAMGKNNLAIFFYGCSFDCLFCQNYSHKLIDEAPKVSIDELLERAIDPSFIVFVFLEGHLNLNYPLLLIFLKNF